MQALAGLLLLLLVASKRSAEPLPDPTPTPDHGGSEGHGGDDAGTTPADVIGSVVGAGSAAAGALAPVFAGGGATAGTGAAGATIATTGGATGTVGTTATVGTGATGAVGTTGSTAAIGAGAVAGAGVLAAQAFTVGLVALPVVVGIVGMLVSRQQGYAKAFLSKLYELMPNARSMHFIERAVWESIVRQEDVSYRQVSDWRLTRVVPAEGVNFQGWRGIAQMPTSVVIPGGPTGFWVTNGFAVARRVRSIALHALIESARRGAALGRAWNMGPKDFTKAMWADALYKAYTTGAGGTNVLGYPNMGGIDRVPLLSGETIAQRMDSTDPYPPENQLAAPDNKRVGTFAPQLQPGDLLTARLLGLMAALNVFQFDPDPFVYLDGNGFRHEYRDRIIARLGLEGQVDRFSWSGSAQGERRAGFVLRPEIWGLRLRFDAELVKERGVREPGSGAVVDITARDSNGKPMGDDAAALTTALANERNHWGLA